MTRLFCLILFLFLTLPFCVKAQDKSNSSISYRGIAGLNVASLKGVDVSDAGARLSFTVGFGVEIPLGQRWSFAPEILYSRQGLKSDIVGSDFEGFLSVIEEDVVFAQNYINLPLTIQFKPFKDFYVFAGPQVSILINESNDSALVAEDAILNRVAPIYFAGTIGAGVKIYKSLGVRASYQFGLSRVYKDLEIADAFFGDENIKTKAYHSVFNLSLIYRFGL